MIKFDENYPVNLDTEKGFNRFAYDLRLNNDILLVTMTIPYDQDNNGLDKSDSDEGKLAYSLGITSLDQDAAIFMYYNGNFDKPIRYPGKKFDTAIARKLIQTYVQDIELKFSSCLPELDQIVSEFVSSEDKSQRKILMEKAEAKVNDYENDKHRYGQIYLKLMSRIQERGIGYIESESNRIKNLLQDKLSTKNRNQFQDRLNILDSFRIHSINLKDEL